MQGHILRKAAVAAMTLILTLPVNAWTGKSVNKTILLATTTSTRDSGLLDILIPVFQKKTGYIVKTIAVGTGKALAMGKRGDADILMTHAPSAEEPLVKAGWLTHRVQFMHNDFIIIGPASDPAKLTRAKSVAGALKQIAEARADFVSRGDNSGTHKKEKALWKAAGLTPKGGWYIESGQGMAATLRIASEKDAYTLTDRSTYLHLQKTLTSKILYEGDPVLLNKYSVMLVNPAKHPSLNVEGARAFHAWVLSNEARDLIRAYGKDQFGQPLFFLDPIR
ncbi:MAG: substrate-binding domain-containing protein [Candidatus Methylomirabilales bacterium]